MDEFAAVFWVLQDERAAALEPPPPVSSLRPAAASNLGACPGSTQRNEIVVIFAWAIQDRRAASSKFRAKRRPLRLVRARDRRARNCGAATEILGRVAALVAGPARLNAR